MKLVLAIINSDDAHSVISHLTKADYNVTKLATSGGFLSAGNVTVLIGLYEERLQECLNLIQKHSHSRRQVLPTTSEMGMGYYAAMPIQVTVGGATVFVMDVDQFHKF